MKNGFMSLGDQVVASLTNFLTGVIIGRFSSKEELGLYSLGFSIVLFVIGLQNSLVSIPYTVYSPRFSGERLDSFTGSTIIQQLLLTSLAALVLLCVTAILSKISSPDGLYELIHILSGAIVFMMIREFGRRICFARLWIRKAILIDTSVGLIQVGGLFWLAYLGVLDAGLAFVVSAVACAVSLFFLFGDIRKSIRVDGDLIKTDLARNWNIARWMVVSSLAYTAGMHLYPWFLAYFHGTGSTGLFAACMGVVALVNPFLLGVSNYLGPRSTHAFMSSGVEGLNRLIIKYFLVFLTVMTFFVILVAFCGEYLVEFVYGSQYAGNGQLVLLLALNLLIASLMLPFRFGLIAIERTDMLFRAYLVSLIVTLAVGILLVKYLGPVGAGVGILISSFSLLIACWWLYLRSRKNVHWAVENQSCEDEWSKELR